MEVNIWTIISLTIGVVVGALYLVFSSSAPTNSEESDLKKSVHNVNNEAKSLQHDAEKYKTGNINPSGSSAGKIDSSLDPEELANLIAPEIKDAAKKKSKNKKNKTKKGNSVSDPPASSASGNKVSAAFDTDKLVQPSQVKESKPVPAAEHQEHSVDKESKKKYSTVNKESNGEDDYLQSLLKKTEIQMKEDIETASRLAAMERKLAAGSDITTNLLNQDEGWNVVENTSKARRRGKKGDNATKKSSYSNENVHSLESLTPSGIAGSVANNALSEVTQHSGSVTGYPSSYGTPGASGFGLGTVLPSSAGFNNSLDLPPPVVSNNVSGQVMGSQNTTQVSSEPVRKIVQVMAKKIGIIIGTKGVTKIAIQEATNTQVNPPREHVSEVDSDILLDVEVVGPIERDVNIAIRAIKDLTTKGYCALLGGENFSEGSISVASNNVADIIGKKGQVLKTIQDKFDVRINVPQSRDRSRPTNAPVKIMVVGAKDNVKKAKEVIKEIVKYHHHEATHPGFVHMELDIEPAYHRFIIGHRGNEINHIQNNYKVQIFIPGPHTSHKLVLIVGRQDNVERAAVYIDKVVAKATAPKEEPIVDFFTSNTETGASADSTSVAMATDMGESDDVLDAGASTANAAGSAVIDGDDEDLAPWMNAYIKKTDLLDISSLAFPSPAGPM